MSSWSIPFSSTRNLSKTDPDLRSNSSKIIEKCQSRLGVWKWTCGLMGFFFISAAYVQHNDPDPFLWIPAYLIPALINWTTCLKIHIHIHRISSDFMNSHRISAISQISLPRWKWLDKLVLSTMLYSLLLGLYTLSHYFYQNHYSGVKVEVVEIVSRWTSEVEMRREEGKELLGLCLIIAWLYLIKDNNFENFGRRGLCLGVTLTVLPLVAWILLDFIEGPSSTSDGSKIYNKSCQ